MKVYGEERSSCANFIKLSKSAWERVTVLLAAEESIGEGVGRRGVLETLEGDLVPSGLPFTPTFVCNMSRTCLLVSPCGHHLDLDLYHEMR